MSLAIELREHLKMKYMGDCKCGNCQLVPVDLLERCVRELEAAETMAELFKGYRLTVIEQRKI